MGLAQKSTDVFPRVPQGLAGCILVLLSTGTLGQFWELHAAEGDPPVAEAPADVAKMSAQDLIESLVDEDDAFRTAVRAELLKRGKAIVPDLRRNMYHADPDVRRWVLNVYREISANSAWNAEIRKALAESKISLKVEGLFLPEAIAQLAKTSGLDISLSPHLAEALKTLKDEQREKLMVTFLAANEPVGKVLAQVLADTGLDASLVFDGVVVEAGEGMRYAVVAQALKTRIKPVALNKVPIDKLLNHLRKKSPVDIVMDPQAVKAMAGQNWTVTLETEREISLQSALAQALNGWDLVIAFDETRLIVTTKDANILQTRQETIEIEDLIRLMQDNRGEEVADPVNLAAEVIAAIKECVQRRTWEKTGAQIAAVPTQDGLQLNLVQWEGTILATRDFVSILRLAEAHKKEEREAAKKKPKSAPAPVLPAP
ncbi:MAG TPA: hypothetical protein VL860_11355, partial [Planctomycetota bacterium]|nr:hypothetical protein [Planctomycetota bacterium]